MSLRQRLQCETAELHAALDARASREGWFDDLARYREWLRSMHAFHSQIGVELAAFDVQGLHGEGRVAHLASDLRDLGAMPMAARPANALQIEDRVAALGALYVTEGATLGARILVKRALALGCSEGHGARFLTAEAQGFATWKAVLAALDSAVLDDSTTSRVVAIAVRSFQLAEECLDGVRAA